MKVQEIIDHAYPCMMAEEHLKAVHEAMLMRDYDTALDHTHAAVAMVAVMQDAIRCLRKLEEHFGVEE